MIFRQLIDDDTKTQTYLLGDEWSREAVLIDPVKEQVERDLQFVDELGLKLTYILDTHVHADHVTGSGALRFKTGAKVMLSKDSGAKGADRYLEDGDALRFGLSALEVRATPGHTSGCLTYVTADRGMAFTGDALFVRGCGRTDFQQGSPQTLYRSIRDKIFSLPDETLIYPGHDYKGRTVSSVREEKLYNPRLGGGRSEAEFAEIMNNLGLPYPRKIDIALPANLQLGLGEDESAAPPRMEAEDAWPIHRTGTGAPSLPAIWVAENLDHVRVVDVRAESERHGPDGRLENDQAVHIEQLAQQSEGWDKDEPIILYCRSGGRSDAAAMTLEGLGFKRVASMSGGVLKWRALGLPLAVDPQG